MCTGSGPKPAAKTPEAPVLPNMAGGPDAKSKKRRSANNSGTLLTGSAGVTDRAPTATKTLLGM
jgi:hypothetical protein